MGWLLHQFSRDFTVLLYLGDAHDALPDDWPHALPAMVNLLVIAPISGPGVIGDPEGNVRVRYDLMPGTVYLIRPDQHVAARTRAFSDTWLKGALARALGNGGDNA